MTKRVGRRLLAGAALLLIAPVAIAQTEKDAAAEQTSGRVVMFVVDTSGSMAGQRLDDAKAALTASIDGLGADDRAGLHRYAGDCGDGGESLVPPATGNRDQLRTEVGGLAAGGGTPTPDALRAAAAEFPADASERIMVLVSDGESSCGDPCPTAQELHADAKVSFTAYTVGFHADDAAETELSCIADATGGKYFSATDTAGIAQAIGSALGGSDGVCQGHGAGGWSFATSLSDNDGLVLDQARFGPRLLAQRISVPYVDVTADWALDGKHSTRRVELVKSPTSGHQGPGIATPVGGAGHAYCRSGDAESVGAGTTYSLQGAPGGIHVWINQSYRFDKRTKGCEPSERLPCARFWPTVSWGSDEQTRHFIDDVRIVQRLEFLPDGGVPSRIDILRDRSAVGAAGSRSTTEDLGSDGSMKYEDRALAIDQGRRTSSTWESVHQTDRAGVGSPGVNPFVGKHPGCSECVHAHWSWNRTTNLTCAPVVYYACFTDGKPEILEGSTQTAYVSVVRARQSDTDPERDPIGGDPNYGARPSGYRELLNREQLRDGQAVMFWDTDSEGTGIPAGVTIDGVLFRKGDAAWPQLSTMQHGGNGAMFFAPARILGNGDQFTMTPRWSAVTQVGSGLDRRLPAGWVLPVDVSYNCAQGHLPHGPFWISVRTGGAVKLINPEGPYERLPAGLPYTLLRTDRFAASPQPSFTPGQPVTEFACHQRRATITFTSYLVFNAAPSPATVPALKLLGAPDGDDVFTPFDEP